MTIALAAGDQVTTTSLHASRTQRGVVVKVYSAEKVLVSFDNGYAYNVHPSTLRRGGTS